MYSIRENAMDRNAILEFMNRILTTAVATDYPGLLRLHFSESGSG
jgi:hypothetical protein